MTLVDVQDGGLARNEKYDVTVGVINLLVSRGGAAPEKITGYCSRENKSAILNILKSQIVWQVNDHE